MKLESPDLTLKTFHDESYRNPFISGQKVRGQGHESTVPVWVFALFWVLASSSFWMQCWNNDQTICEVTRNSKVPLSLTCRFVTVFPVFLPLAVITHAIRRRTLNNFHWMLLPVFLIFSSMIRLQKAPQMFLWKPVLPWYRKRHFALQSAQAPELSQYGVQK